MSIKAIISANTIPGPKRVRPEHPDIFFMLLTVNPAIDGVEAPQGSMGAVPTDEGYITYYKWGTGDFEWSPMINRRIAIEYIGKTTGANKTTLVADGATLSEEFQIGNELWFRWGVPANIIPRKDVRLKVHFYLNSSEVGKVVSWQLDIAESNGVPVNVLMGTEFDLDIPVSEQFIDAHAEFLLTHEEYNKTDLDSLNFRLERIASSNDPIAHPRVHLITLEF